MSLTALAEDILLQSNALDAHLAAAGLPPASFDQDVLCDLPNTKLELARLRIVDQTDKLRRLALGPRQQCLEMCERDTDFVSLHFIYRMKIAAHVPIQGTITFAELSETLSIPDRTIARYLRHAMLNNVFHEPKPGHVAHTAFSRLIATDAAFNHSIGFLIEEIVPGTLRSMGACEKWGWEQSEQNKTGFQLANNTDRSVYEDIGSNEERVIRCGGAMSSWTANINNLKYLLDCYDWSQIDIEGSTFVDIGGGVGAVSKMIAGKCEKLRFVVQEREETAEKGRKSLPEELRGRVDFVAGDIFDPSPVKGAQAYFMRWILHNWSDKYALNILQALVPGLKKGSRVLIYETVLLDREEKGCLDKYARNLDLVMAGSFAGMERRPEDWKDLFRQVDGRFVIKGYHSAPGSAFTLVEAVWEP